MTRDEASLIVRMHMALMDEGIGPRPELEKDRVIIEDAVRVAGDLFEHWELEYYGMAGDDE